MNDRLRLADLWDRISICLRENFPILLPVAGAFFFLPSVIITRFMPAGTPGTFEPSLIPPLILLLLLQTIGQLAILVLVLDSGKPTVGAALRTALHRLLPAVGVQLAVFAMFCGLLIVGQLIALLLGGAGAVGGGAAGNASLMRLAALGLLIASPAILYLLARLAVVFPVLIAEPLTPFEAMRRTFRLTAGNAGRILALILIAAVLYLFLQLAVGTALGGALLVAGKLLGMEGLGMLLTIILTAALGSLANVVVTVGLAFIYRDLAR